jgi:response regulator RpfG family c-di-GMP phosphodiesterase
MYRPCFLVIDREFPSSISTRKLVLETAKYNVITAYASDEALDLLKRFPAVDGVVMDASGHVETCAELVAKLRALSPKIRIVLTSGRHDIDCGDVDLHLESYDPRKLLDALAKLFPVENALITEHDETLNKELKMPNSKIAK